MNRSGTTGRTLSSVAAIVAALLVVLPNLTVLVPRPYAPALFGAAPSTSAPLTIRGQLGGTGRFGLAIAGSALYLTAGPRLTVFDITNADSPRPRGSTSLPGFAQQVLITGTFAYVATGGAGLAIVDVSDPDNPQEVGRLDTPGSALGVAVLGSTAYVADGSAGLQVVDVADPSAPRLLRTVPDLGTPTKLALIDGPPTLVILDTKGTLQALGLNNPTAPLLPAVPIETGQLKIGALASAGHHLYVTDPQLDKGGLAVVDFGANHSAEVVATVPVPGATGLVLSGPIALVICAESLCFIDISDPAHPIHRGRYLGLPAPPNGDPIGAAARKDGTVYAVVFNAEAATLVGLDANDPNVAAETSRLSLEDQVWYAQRVWAGNGWAVANARGPSTRLVDTRAPVASARWLSDGEALDVAFLADQAFVQLDQHLLTIGLDLPSGSAGDPRPLARPGSQIAVRPPWLVVASPPALEIFDLRVRDPFPSPLGRLGVGTPIEMELLGDVAYVLNQHGDIVVVDVSDPYFPRRLEVEGLPSAVQDMDFDGRLAYFSTGLGPPFGLEIVDVGEPRAPRRLSQMPVEASRNIAAGAGAVYLSGFNNQLFVIDARNPSQPIAHKTVPLYSLIADLAFGGNALFVADGLAGLLVVEPAFGAAPKPTPGSSPAPVPTPTLGAIGGRVWIPWTNRE